MTEPENKKPFGYEDPESIPSKLVEDLLKIVDPGDEPCKCDWYCDCENAGGIEEWGLWHLKSEIKEKIMLCLVKYEV